MRPDPLGSVPPDRVHSGGSESSLRLAKHILDIVLALPEVDQLELVDRVRQRLRQTSMPLSESQRAILGEQVAAFAAGGDPGLPWDEVEADVRSELRER